MRRNRRPRSSSDPRSGSGGKAEFYANGSLIGTDTAAPFSIAWASPAPGAYSLTAKVTDSLGTETTSAPRSITVNAINMPPVVSLTAPANNAKYVTPATITVSASATSPEANDTVAKVEFYAKALASVQMVAHISSTSASRSSTLSRSMPKVLTETPMVTSG